jgi:hypothetical protein
MMQYFMRCPAVWERVAVAAVSPACQSATQAGILCLRFARNRHCTLATAFRVCNPLTDGPPQSPRPAQPACLPKRQRRQVHPSMGSLPIATLWRPRSAARRAALYGVVFYAPSGSPAKSKTCWLPTGLPGASQAPRPQARPFAEFFGRCRPGRSPAHLPLARGALEQLFKRNHFLGLLKLNGFITKNLIKREG